MLPIPIVWPFGTPLSPLPPAQIGKDLTTSWIHSPKQALKVQIRWLIRRDMPECLDIERQAFESAWTEEDFLCCLRQRNCIGMIAEYNHRIVGFMIYELHKAKLHVLNFAVDPEFSRQAIGTQLVEKLVDKLSQQRRQEIVLEVRESNLAAQLFFKKWASGPCSFSAATMTIRTKMRTSCASAWKRRLPSSSSRRKTNLLNTVLPATLIGLRDSLGNPPDANAAKTQEPHGLVHREAFLIYSREKIRKKKPL